MRKTGNIEDPVKKALSSYLHIETRLFEAKNQYHPSRTNIKDSTKSKNISSFSFQPVLKLKNMNEDIFSRLIFQNFNQSLINVEFPHCLKQTEVFLSLKKRKNLTNPVIDL